MYSFIYSYLPHRAFKIIHLDAQASSWLPKETPQHGFQKKMPSEGTWYSKSTPDKKVNPHSDSKI